MKLSGMLIRMSYMIVAFGFPSKFLPHVDKISSHTKQNRPKDIHIPPAQ